MDLPKKNKRRKTHIVIVVGEASGDLIGAPLIKALKRHLGEKTRITGVGGPLMKKEGFQELYPYADLSYMGVWEGGIRPLIKIYHIFKALVAYIKKERPDMVITIDFPGFNFKLGKKIKPLGIPHVHYVAPTVWAWKAYRAKKIAQFLKHLFVLFPFESSYFIRHNLPTSFVGHPLIEDNQKKPSENAFRKIYGIPKGGIGVIMLPGSRLSELNHHITIFRDVAEKLKQTYPNLHVIIPTLPHLVDYLKENWMSSVPTIFITDALEKKAAYHFAMVALAASGTVTLELALADLPMIVAYKVSKITAFIVRRLVKIPYFCMVNILLGRKLVPEFLQENCTVEGLLKALTHLMGSAEARGLQKTGFRQVKDLLRPEKGTPSESAALIIKGLLEKEHNFSKNKLK